MSGKTGLGRGLDALIPEEFDSSILENNERVQNLPINKVIPNPEQPRKHFEEEALNELAKSIKNHGIVQPLIVTKYNDDYRIIAGERRWRSAKIAGLKEVPAVVRSLKLIEELEVAIIENVQRVDLSPLEQAQSIERLHDQFNLSYAEIAKKLGKAVPTIHNTVRLLQLPKSAMQALKNGQISEGHARAILALKEDSQKQADLLESVLKFGWSVRQAEQFVTASRQEEKKSTKKVKEHMATTNTQTEALAKRLNTSINIRRTAKGGKLEVYFKDDDDLKRITTELIG
ncbi:MAG: ParB/RepB/Spo0J family partition protein [Candidatus Nomurabacteria bacterium]|nr:ParB/RepB/Spo0J family partition protein [Candidatus Saccharibacteria bacterium]USN95678.1 MAG: ParB/RepB/Spo0J family partition protein [Candidatus Nomurabacteria bacterium]